MKHVNRRSFLKKIRDLSLSFAVANVTVYTVGIVTSPHHHGSMVAGAKFNCGGYYTPTCQDCCAMGCTAMPNPSGCYSSCLSTCAQQGY
jgi:hypothetical protein